MPVLNPVQESVVNGVPFNVPSIFSSMNSPLSNGRIVDVPFVTTGGAPGLNQNDISTSQVPAIAVSREGAARFVAHVDRYLVLDENGEAVRVSDGKVIGRSAFLRSRGSFHLFNVCNQWMARALRAAGVDINARAAWLAGPLIRQVRKAGQTSCPTNEVTQ